MLRDALAILSLSQERDGLVHKTVMGGLKTL